MLLCSLWMEFVDIEIVHFSRLNIAFLNKHFPMADLHNRLGFLFRTRFAN